jgi:citrate synthase
MTGYQVRPDTSSLTYRGYPVQELCRQRSFEEVAYLLWHGELPGPDQISAQNRAERAQRPLDPAIADAIADQPFTADPLDTVGAAVMLLGGNDQAGDDVTSVAIRAIALRLFAVLPSVIAAGHRRRHGLGAVAPRDHLGYAANFLCMTFGKVPEPQVVAAFETSLILFARHRLVPAASTTADAASAGFDTYSAIADSIREVKGSQQAAAGETVFRMINEIAIPDNAKPWLEEALAGGRKITGFGHPAYRDGDPRVPLMRAGLGMIASLRGGQDLLEVYDALAAAMYDVKGLRPNLYYPAGLACRLIGFDAPDFAPILVAARLPGWTAHLADQLAASSVIQPRSAHDQARHCRAGEQ